MKLTSRQKQIAGFSIVLLVAVALAVTFWPIFNTSASPSNPNERKLGSLTDVAVDPNTGSAKQTLPAIILEQSQFYDRVVTHTGTVESRKRTMVAFQRGGMVTNLLADEGERVSPKTLLAVLDNRHLLGQQASLQANLKQASAVLAELVKGPRSEAISSAKNVVEDLQQQLKAQELRTSRSADLVRTKSIARQDYERELYAKKGLAARLKSAQSQLEELETGTRKEKLIAQEATVQGIEAQLQIVQYNLDDCQLEAPFPGMIIARFTDPGSVVSSGSPVFELIDDKNLEVHVGIPPIVSESLAVGAKLDLVIGKHKLQGTLRTVLPTIDPATRTCKAILDVEVSDETLNPILFSGQLAKVQLIERVHQSGYWIPTDALTADHSGLWSCLVVDPAAMQGQQGIAKKHSVEILFQRDQEAFVRGTLKPGGLLLSSGIHRVVAGQIVAVAVDASEATAATTEQSSLEARRFSIESTASSLMPSSTSPN